MIYAIISQLLTIMSANSLNNIFTAQNIGGAFQGASQMLLISLASILLSIMILLIPFLAKRIVSGDVGSTMFAVAGVAAASVQAADGWMGRGAKRNFQCDKRRRWRGFRRRIAGSTGMASISSRPPAPPAEGWAGAALLASNGSAPAGSGDGGDGVTSAARPPPSRGRFDGSALPSSGAGSHGQSGRVGRYSIPHAVGWPSESAIGSTQRR